MTELKSPNNSILDDMEICVAPALGTRYLHTCKGLLISQRQERSLRGKGVGCPECAGWPSHFYQAPFFKLLCSSRASWSCITWDPYLPASGWVRPIGGTRSEVRSREMARCFLPWLSWGPVAWQWFPPPLRASVSLRYGAAAPPRLPPLLPPPVQTAH